jgi:hypothetical protein
MSVAVTSRGTTLDLSPAVPLFEVSLLGGPAPVIPFKQQHDVAKDGRFLLNVPVDTGSAQGFTAVVNWTVGLRR